MSEFSGRTINEAIEEGLQSLGLSREEVDIEVIEEGRGGVFGLGSKPAAVRITPKRAAQSPPDPAPPASESPADEPEPEQTVRVAETAEVSQTSHEDHEAPAMPETPEVSAEDEQVLGIARDFLQGLLDRMGLETAVEAEIVPQTEDEEITYYLNIAGQDLGVLIGRRGETLADIQFLVRLATNHQTHDWRRIEVDVENYKRRREVSLQRLAENMADRAVREGRTVMLEAMPARERRLVHIALRDRPDVTTTSIGEGENRKVTIVPV